MSDWFVSAFMSCLFATNIPTPVHRLKHNQEASRALRKPILGATVRIQDLKVIWQFFV